MVNRASRYFPKGDHSATEAKLNNMNKRKVKHHRNSSERSVMNYWGQYGKK